MATIQASRREIFRTITTKSYCEWPTYDSTPLYDRSSLGGLEEDVRTVARVWFEHDAHESVEDFVCCLPLAYITFEAHDRYTGTTRYGMEQLVRVFLLKELHGWSTRAHSSNISIDVHRLESASALRACPINRRSGERGTVVSQPNSERRSKQRRGACSFKQIGPMSCSLPATGAIISKRAIQR